MITRSELERLAALRTDDGIVTAYIKVDPRLSYERNQPEMKFKGAFSRARRDADERGKEILDRERDRILRHLADWKQEGAGIVIFASTPADIWEVVLLNAAVPSWVSAGNSSDTSLLARTMEEYPRMAVVMLDGGDARIYLAEQGSEAKASESSVELPGRHDQGGWSQARFQRHIDFHHNQRLQEVAESLKEIYYERHFDRLVLVGVDSATKQFEGILDEPIRRHVIGQLNADFKQDTDDAILERARELAQEQERSSEAALVGEIVNAAQSNGKGAVGLQDTIGSLIEGKVHTLAIADGLTKPGARCLNCDYFAAEPFAACPACAGEDVEELPDAVEHAIEYAILSGGHVNVVSEEAAEMLVAHGGAGALLRYAG